MNMYDLVAIREHALAQVAGCIRAGDFGKDPFDVLTPAGEALARHQRTVAELTALIKAHGRWLDPDHVDAKGLD